MSARATAVVAAGLSNAAGSRASLDRSSSSAGGGDNSSCGSNSVQPEAAAERDHGLEAFKAFIAERRFMCTQCGKCCTGDGEVWISDAEAGRIAAFLGQPLQRFLRQHTHAHSRLQGFCLLRTQGNEAGDCTFLRPDNTCAIHAVRPQQCSTYPWWPDLVNPKDWAWEKENICEGFDHPDAPPTDLDEAARQLRLATAQEYQKQLSAKPGKRQRGATAHAAAHAAQQGPSPPAQQHAEPPSSGPAQAQGAAAAGSSARASRQRGGPPPPPPSAARGSSQARQELPRRDAGHNGQ